MLSFSWPQFSIIFLEETIRFQIKTQNISEFLGAFSRYHRSCQNNQVSLQVEESIDKSILNIDNQLAYYRQLGLRSRILGLPLMIAAVLTLLWRQVPSARELTRLLAREDLLWCKAVKVSQQALSKRLLAFPAELFERVFKDLVPQLAERWQQRRKRPLPLAIIIARQTFDRIWIADGSTLEALFRKLESLQDAPVGQLAGKICAVIDLTTRLPVEIWYREGARDHDTNFVPEVLALIPGPKID